MRLVLVALAIASFAAGAAVAAGDEDAGGAALPAGALTVVDDAGPDRPPTRATLRCTSTATTGTGRLRDLAARACRTARARRATLHGPRADEVCTEIYGGPQVARVTGSVGSKRVARRFDRTNGCRISEWDRLSPLLPRGR
jgi:hypothetical protein